jgi:glycosyltransferase involved in cell wall biosynthesis
MEKPVIAVGARWACDYMTDGVHGLMVDYEDRRGLEAAIRRILEGPEAARAMAARGREHARQFTTRRSMAAVHRLALAEVGR